MNTQDEIRIQSQKNPAQLEREIDQQRDHISELVEALSSKLSPGEMFERVLSYSKGGGREFAGNLASTVRSNPVPTLLTAVGMLWLYAGSRNDGGYHAESSTSAKARLGERFSDAREGVGERVQHVREGAQHLREEASDKIGSARRSAHDLADSTRHGLHRANQGYHDMLENNPLALGAMGVAAGALIGAMIPVTRKENELMGPTRDRVKSEAKQKVRSGYEKAAEAGREVTSSASGTDTRDSAKTYRQSTGDTTSFDRPSSQ